MYNHQIQLNTVKPLEKVYKIKKNRKKIVKIIVLIKSMIVNELILYLFQTVSKCPTDIHYDSFCIYFHNISHVIHFFPGFIL